MEEVRMIPTTWATFPHISDVEPVGERDQVLLEEIRAVLERHGALERFGVTLIHRHFGLEEGEIILESTDSDRRRQTVEVVSEAETLASGNVIATQWVFDTSRGGMVCNVARAGAALPAAPDPQRRYGAPVANWVLRRRCQSRETLRPLGELLRRLPPAFERKPAWVVRRGGSGPSPMMPVFGQDRVLDGVQLPEPLRAGLRLDEAQRARLSLCASEHFRTPESANRTRE